MRGQEFEALDCSLQVLLSRRRDRQLSSFANELRGLHLDAAFVLLRIHEEAVVVRLNEIFFSNKRGQKARVLEVGYTLFQKLAWQVSLSHKPLYLFSAKMQ